MQLVEKVRNKCLKYLVATEELDKKLIIINVQLLGEVIELYCCVVNDSSVECRPRALLYQSQIYMCGRQHRAWQMTITEPIFGTTIAKHSDDEQLLSVRIPSHVSLSIKSELISVKYFIHVTLDIPHAFDIHVNLPFVVTTQSAIDSQK